MSIQCSDRQYCIEIILKDNQGNRILILKNDVIVDQTPEFDLFNDTHTTCFNTYDLDNDIFELRHSGGTDGVTIHVNLIDKGTVKQLFFGSNADLDWFWIDGDDFKCQAHVETSHSLRIKNGTIIESECVGKCSVKF